jgi:hypothetical protein
MGNNDLVGGDIQNANTAIGYNSLRYMLNGEYNVALGWRAGYSFESGDSNIYLGYSGALEDSEAMFSESNTMRLGEQLPDPPPPYPVPHITRTFVAGVNGVTTGLNDATMMLIDSAGQLGTISSSQRYKQDIEDLGSVSERLLQLRPVSFRYIQPQTDGSQPVQYGLIAEEVAELLPELVVYDQQGQPETVKYHLLSTLLLGELQRLATTSQQQQQSLLALHHQQETQMGELRAQVELLSRQTESLMVNAVQDNSPQVVMAGQP